MNKGIGFVGSLQIALIVLKLTHVINWRWLWILSPIWITFGIYVIIFVICCLILNRKD